MAYQSKSWLAQEYNSLNAISAFMGLVVAIAAAHVFEILEVNFLVISYTMLPIHATILTFAGLFVAGIASDTRSWQQYEAFEQILVGAGAVLVIAIRYVPQVQDIVFTNQYTQIVAFLWMLAMWLVVAR